MTPSVLGVSLIDEYPDAVCLLGNRPDFIELASAIEAEIAEKRDGEILLTDGRIAIAIDGTPGLRASWSPGTLDLTGDPNSLAWFGQTVRTFAAREDFGPELHLEYHGEHPYWRRDSLPLRLETQDPL